MCTDLWATRDLPLLSAIGEAEAVGAWYPQNKDLIEATGLTDREVQRGLRALLESRYIDGVDAAAEEECYLLEIRLQERGRRTLRLWPAENVYDDLIAQLERRLELEPDPVVRGRLKSFLQGVLAAGREVGIEVMASLATRAATGIG